MGQPIIQTVSRSLFFTIFDRQKGRVTYHWRAKAGDLWRDSESVSVFDCSGAMQYWFFRASEGGIIMPEGSADQHQFCTDRGWKKCNYADVIANRDEGRFFVCYLEPKGEHPGHTWMVSNGQTYECFGSGGVNSRTPTIAYPCHCDTCFEVPTSN